MLNPHEVVQTGGPIPVKTPGQERSAEHLPDAVTIVTMLHFLATAQREDGAREEERLNVKWGGRGTGRDSFGPGLGNRQLIMCLHTLTSEDRLSLHCAAQRDNGSLKSGPVDGHVTAYDLLLPSNL